MTNEDLVDPSCSPSTRESIYIQHCEFYRYQDGLRWSRFQTAATVEGVLLAGLFALDNPLPLGMRIFLTVSAGFLVCLICKLSLKDVRDAQRHLWMIRQFERSWPIRESKVGAKGVAAREGLSLMKQAIWALNGANVLLLGILVAEGLCSRSCGIDCGRWASLFWCRP